ncbi:MAG: nucleoside phosphorylase [Bacteroidales bacterium]|jgi:uridine phosphorylase|nr:nucleoside phosphorylase [Bacteroidales bacterium]
MKRIAESELILNDDGSIFHLHITPEQLADKIILVGDPGRVKLAASFFSSLECEVESREFRTATGMYQGKRISVISTGIGTDNIDIVMNELDALVNVDLETRLPKEEHKSLEIVRVGTSGSLQADIPIDSFLISEKSIGFDGLLNFYEGRNEVSDIAFEEAFVTFVNWNDLLAKPYVVESSTSLVERIHSEATIKGVTISAPGFYGPQGRIIRLNTMDNDLNDKIAAFRYEGHKITNYEMESSAIAGLSLMLGHQATTVCAIIANRANGTSSPDYKKTITQLLQYVLDRI